jgi:tyrosinase
VDYYGTFTIAPGTTEYGSDSLTPFTSSTTGSIYTSNTARNLKNWGYTYPEICDWNQTKAQLSATVTAKVNALHNPSGAYSRRKRHPRDMSTTTKHEWFVNIQVAKSELGSSSVVFIFVGAPPADTATWKGANNLAGSLFVSEPPNYSMGDNKRYTHGEVPLKEALAKVKLPDYSEATVARFLKENLEWRIQKVRIFPMPKTRLTCADNKAQVDGTVIDFSNCPSLEIKVQDEEVTPPENEHNFPTYGSPTVHPEITEGKVGGYDAADSE